LDDDGDLEVVLGHAAYHHDGAPYYLTELKAGYPQVADLDGDGRPEILLTTVNGVSLLEHDGTIVYQDLRPTGDPPGGTNWHRPATIHDFDGDGEPEFAVSSANNYTVYESDATIVWQAPISDLSGIAAGTAFDFLGDGVAEAMYADEQTLYVFDGAGAPLLQVSRKSGTLSEYPTVADIDNDGSAEILVVSNGHLGGGDPGIQVFRDAEDRWIQARRIWNQHTYHVTNVREDGTIPQFEPQSWKLNNTFRTNAQIEGGGICIPVPPG
ncbi:MAG: VCBS repeat-containing protein, partial [Myxococcales bacterium]|nr:VCBS repeat-containing protein [Myxococcales bacterium]